MADKKVRLTKRFYPGFNNWEGLRKAFCDAREWEEEIFEKKLAEIQPAREPALVFAAYDYGNWEGYSLVIYKHKGKWWVNEAGHCSCYGLEGSWSPTPHTKADIEKMYIKNSYYDDPENCSDRISMVLGFREWWKRHSKVKKKKVGNKVTVIEISSGNAPTYKELLSMSQFLPVPSSARKTGK